MCEYIDSSASFVVSAAQKANLLESHLFRYTLISQLKVNKITKSLIYDRDEQMHKALVDNTKFLLEVQCSQAFSHFFKDIRTCRYQLTDKLKQANKMRNLFHQLRSYFVAIL